MQGSRRRIRESFIASLVILFTFMATGVLGQLRQVDQGKPPWKFYLCDSSGTNCVGTETTATPGVYRLMTSTSGGGAGGGTVAQGTSGSIGAPWFVQFTNTGIQITNTVPVNVTNPSLAVTQSGNWTMTSAPSGTTTITGSVTNTVAVNVTNPSFPVTQSGNWSITNSGFTANQGTPANVTAGWPAIGGYITTSTALTSASPLDTTMGLVTSGYGVVVLAIDVSGAVSGTINVQGSNNGGSTYHAISGVRVDLATASWAQGFAAGTVALISIPASGLDHVRIDLNPAITGTGTSNVYMSAVGVGGPELTVLNGQAISAVSLGGMVQTDTTASSASGNNKQVSISKFGKTVVGFTIPDWNVTTSFGPVTATTASQLLAAPGAAYRYAIYGGTICNLSGVVATQMNVLDSAGTIASFPWTQTATTSGEERCLTLGPFDVPYLSAANSTISVQLTTSNATGVRGILSMAKTGSSDQ